jgi:hypothetical protein
MHGAEIQMIGWSGSGSARTPTGDWIVKEEFVVFVAAEDLKDALDRLKRVDADFAIIVDPRLFRS